MTGRTIVVTGAFGVLGTAGTEAATQRGWRVVAVDYSQAPAAWPVKPALVLGGVDLADPAAAKATLDRAAAELGGIDALANIAGGFAWQTVEEGDPAAWSRLWRLNLETALHASRAALPHLKASGSGRIVNVGANGAVKAAAGMGAYAASKQAVHKLTESLAEELKDAGVTVNAVLPSILDTAANRADMPDADPAKWVAPADLASVILFLASEEARAVTGALLPVTGKV